MTIVKPFVQQVIYSVGETQDGGKLNPKDEYSRFLLQLIHNNTETNSQSDEAGTVDVDSLQSDLKYAIHEFTKALKAIELFVS